MWTKKEVADYLKVTTRQIDILRQKYGLPCVKFGGTVRFKPDEIESWLTKQRSVK